jgi:hypothetical protein
MQSISVNAADPIRIKTVNNTAVSDSASLRFYAPFDYDVKRSKASLFIHYQLDSAEKVMELKAKRSFAYWLNIYFNYGIGMFVDKNNPRSYAYSKHNYLVVDDKLIKIDHAAPVPKGRINLSFSFPVPAFFNVKSLEGSYQAAGVLGLATGLEYYYKANHYLSLDLGAATSRFLDYIGPGYVNSASAIYLGIRNNQEFGRLDMGYGLSMARMGWQKETVGDTIVINQSFKNTAMGLSLSAGYKLGNYIEIGVLYQPAFISLSSSPTMGYQHFISLNLKARLPLNGTIQH